MHHLHLILPDTRTITGSSGNPDTQPCTQCRRRPGQLCSAVTVEPSIAPSSAPLTPLLCPSKQNYRHEKRSTTSMPPQGRTAPQCCRCGTCAHLSAPPTCRQWRRRRRSRTRPTARRSRRCAPTAALSCSTRTAGSPSRPGRCVGWTVLLQVLDVATVAEATSVTIVNCGSPEPSRSVNPSEHGHRIA